MKLYGAIDLHSNNSVTVVSNEQDHVVYEKHLPNDLALITQSSPPTAIHSKASSSSKPQTGIRWSTD